MMQAAVSVAIVLWTQAARAGFDPETGEVVPDPGAIVSPLDDVSALDDLDLQPAIYDLESVPIVGEDAAGAFVDADEAIEGEGAVAVGGDLAFLYVYFGGETASLAGRRVTLTFWQRPQGTRLAGQIEWYGGDLSSYGGYTQLGAIRVQPTGAVTDDGWEEWTTGPFDWAWAGETAPLQLALYDSQLDGAPSDLGGGLSYDPDARVVVDAFSILPTGPAAVPEAPCDALDEAAICGDVGLCRYGACVDAASLVGQPILDAGLRNEFLDRREFELRHFEGGRDPASRIDDIAATMDGLRNAPSAVTFWPTLNTAYQSLLDGHANAPGAPAVASFDAGVCLHLGEADLLEGAPLLPLVFSLPAEDNALSERLEVGDALVAVDGIPVDEWIAANPRLLGHSGDLRGAAVVLAPSVLAAALDAGSVVEFARCAGPDPCADAEVQRITADLGALIRAGFAEGRLADVLSGSTAECDWRFVRPIDAPDALDYAFAGHTDEGGIRTLVINGVPGTAFGADSWRDEVVDAFADAPPLLILDQRLGGGGTFEGVDLILGPLFPEDNAVRVVTMPTLADDGIAADRAALEACAAPGPIEAGYCGNTVLARPGRAGAATRGTSAGAKLAVLDALDISGNDYVARTLALRTTGETRIFGAGATYGAYGQISLMPGYLGESGGSLQTEDALFLASDSDPSVDFQTSNGAIPDMIVYQTQSDCLLGRDTVVEAARAWLLGAP